MISNETIFSSINPYIFKKHLDANTLKKMWKDLNKEYRNSIVKYKQYGIHDPDFTDIESRIEEDKGDYDFWKFSDFKSVYYLRKHIQLKPNANDLIKNTLPGEM